MDGMSENDLNEALEHDVARKANGASQVVVHPGAEITPEDVDAIEIRQAYLSKAVSLSYVDAAHACVRLALHEVAPVVDLTVTDEALPDADAERVKLLMDLGERAVRIAKELDVLGDKNLVRYEDTKDSEPTKQ